MAITELTERDKKLFNLLSLAGVIKTDQAKLAYGNVSKYHIRRIERLASEGLITRENGYIRMTAKGMRLAGVENNLRIAKHRYKEQAITVDLMTQFPDWDFTLAIHLKRKQVIENGAQVNAFLKINNTKYGVYILTNVPRKKTLQILKTEMTNLRLIDIERILAFYTNPKIAEAFYETELPSGVQELCLLPYPAGVSYFKQLYNPEFHSFVKERFPNLSSSNRPFAHFEWRDAFITVLFHNDLIKRYYLEEYLKYAQKREGRRCIVITTPEATSFAPAGVEIVPYTIKGG
ncbi:MAG: hypothetical protein XD50_1355 [Clostridia bacterium 41_269]|nr:MAG: hypothetical protein XD50_1355 [Clostridia bacterium 41_269]